MTDKDRRYGAGPEHSYEFRDDGTFVIANYHHAKPFSSFLPGLAGLWGIPIWAYTVNRGQGVACFGTEDKSHAIMPFASANLHHRRVADEGFRTFIRLLGDTGGLGVYEPFRATQAEFDVRNEMRITFDGLEVVETNHTLGLEVHVRYVPLPGERSAALVRTVTIRNTGPRARELEVIDGAPRVLPYYIELDQQKILPYITEAYLKVEGLDERRPFLQQKALPSDTPETQFVDGGHFFFGVEEGRHGLLPAIVDPEVVFGDLVDLHRPYALEQLPHGQRMDAGQFQATHCTTPSAMVAWPLSLEAGDARTLHLPIGWARRRKDVADLAARFGDRQFVARKASDSRSEVQKVRHRFFLHCSHRELSEYAPQTYLDNSLRGGWPISLKAGGRAVVYHVYSRRHGDLERDYNFFRIEPTFFSQGNGAFRDVNQNRRCDVWFNPDVGGENVRFFFNLIQPDGFNPMLVKGASFRIDQPEELAVVIGRAFHEKHVPAVLDRLGRPYTPGDLFAFLDERNIPLPQEPMGLLTDLLAISEKVAEAEFEAGYWCDHWYYNFDQLETFLAIYPDRLRELLIDDRSLTYWDPDVRVRPRSEKHVLYDEGKVRQIDSLTLDEDKSALIASRDELPRCVRDAHGRGEVYRTNLLEKITCLLLNKLASLSASGMGVEMDGGRPGWHDSINGLPGLFGASTSECYHLLRAIRLLRSCAKRIDLSDEYAQPMPLEITSLARAVDAALSDYLSAGEDKTDRDMGYWRATNDAKEHYRMQVRLGFSGDRENLSWGEIRKLLARGEERIEVSLAGAVDDRTGLPVTYLSHEAKRWEQLADEQGEPRRTPRGLPLVRVEEFQPHKYPLFLEAPTHSMRIRRDPAEGRKIWQAMREGPLYDRKLGMYIVGDSVQEESTETGRIWAWPPGWFENENVFTHMAHKYMLATLQAGLVEEFYEDFRAAFVPFQPVERFARSPIENISFMVSSRHPRPAYHGRGFLPRSSGTTAEVLQTLLIASFGETPYRVEDGELVLRFQPALAGWLFTEQAETREIVGIDGSVQRVDLPPDSFSAMLHGEVLVTYVNPSRKDTFGPDAARVSEIERVDSDGGSKTIRGDALRGEDACAVRQRRVKRLVVTLT